MGPGAFRVGWEEWASLPGLGLRTVVVDARGCGHIQALGRADVRGVVNADEGGFVVAFEGGAGGAVGLVADDQVEIG